MVPSIHRLLAELGPSRSSLIAQALIDAGLKPEAARQRLSRARPPIHSFPIPMLPKREAFLYLESQRPTDQFWTNFIRDLRATGSVYAAAIDALAAKGGFIPAAQFAAITGAPQLPVQKQLSASIVTKHLLDAEFIVETGEYDQSCYRSRLTWSRDEYRLYRARDMAERILLDAVREWARRIGLASYNSIRVRSEDGHKPIGPFLFDLAGPSYLLPLQAGAKKPGFTVADVFVDGTMDANHIQYFIRKAKLLASTLPEVGILPILVAPGFDAGALKAGHAAGIVLATPRDLFGKRVGVAFSGLIEVLKRAAATAAAHPERLVPLLESLSEIEGRSMNLRGVLFELVVAYLVRRDAPSIDMNVIARDSKGRSAEIDILKVEHQGSRATAIECKGKEPGGVLDVDEVSKWLDKTSVFREHLRGQSSLREAAFRFEIWTSGAISADALALLQKEQALRTQNPIDWRDGQAVLTLAKQGKEKGIADALAQHFIKHPLSSLDQPEVPGDETLV